MGIDDAELQFAVDQIVAVATARVHLVVLPHRVDEEGLHRLLLLYLDGVDGIEQVRVVEHDLGGLLGEVFADGVDEVQQSGISEILDIVHHGGARGLDVVGELTYVGRLLRAFLGYLVEEFLDLREILQFNLLDKQDVHLGHHVHGLQQVLAVVAMLLEEGIEAVMDIVLEIAVG